MFPFGKKKQDEEEEIDEELVKKPIRDLKPENKKARKEPKKPWGKKERLIVLVVLLSTVTLSAILAIFAQGFEVKAPEISTPKIPIPGITFEQTYSSEKKDCCSDLEEKFNEKTENLLGTYGFSFIDLDSGSSSNLRGDESFQAASLIKVPTAIALYKEAEAGNIDLENLHTLKESEKLGGNGSLAGVAAGTKISYRDLTKYMLSQSDNTAFNIIEILLGDRKIQKTIDSLGMTKTSIADNLTSANDMALIFRILEEGSVLSKANSEELLTYLEQSKFDSWLTAGIPQGIRVAHKYGREIRVVSDAGIVYAQNPYIVVILSEGVNEAEADLVFPELSRIFYEEVSN